MKIKIMGKNISTNELYLQRIPGEPKLIGIINKGLADYYCFIHKGTYESNEGTYLCHFDEKFKNNHYSKCSGFLDKSGRLIFADDIISIGDTNLIIKEEKEEFVAYFYNSEHNEVIAKYETLKWVIENRSYVKIKYR